MTIGQREHLLKPFAAGTTKYQMLGVATDTSEADLKIAYRRAALLFHPDRHPDEDRAVAEQIFKDITGAYRTLSSAATRRRYDYALARGKEYHETAASEDAVRLEDVLAEIQQYEYVFSRDQLSLLDQKALDLVVENLMDNLGEQVVAVYPLSQAPLDVQFPGTFTTGAVVITNLRVLMPFTYEWQETSGNVRTTYRGLSAPVAQLPLVTRFRIASRKRLTSDVVVAIDHQDRSVAFQGGGRNLAKLLLIASLWGIPVETEETDARRSELRTAIFRPWTFAFWSALALIAVAAVIGWFSEAGIIGAPAAVVAWCGRIGLAQAATLLAALWTAHGVARWVRAYQPPDLVQLIGPTPNGPTPSAGASLAGVA
jgi:hypothetical protein